MILVSPYDALNPFGVLVVDSVPDFYNLHDFIISIIVVLRHPCLHQ